MPSSACSPARASLSATKATARARLSGGAVGANRLHGVRALGSVAGYADYVDALPR